MTTVGISASEKPVVAFPYMLGEMETINSILLIGLAVLAPSLGQGRSAVPDVAEWQTYRDAKYGYEVRYPEGFDLWPTGPAGERDGRAIRIGRREYAAFVPILDIYMQSEVSCAEPFVDVESPDMDTIVGDVDINGVRVREVTHRWKGSGEIVFVDLCIREVLVQFHAQPGLRNFRETVWWEIISTFRRQDE